MAKKRRYRTKRRTSGKRKPAKNVSRRVERDLERITDITATGTVTLMGASMLGTVRNLY